MEHDEYGNYILSPEEMEERLWEGYRHGFRAGQGETPGPPPEGDQNKGGKNQGEAVSRVEFIKQHTNK